MTPCYLEPPKVDTKSSVLEEQTSAIQFSSQRQAAGSKKALGERSSVFVGMVFALEMSWMMFSRVF